MTQPPLKFPQFRPDCTVLVVDTDVMVLHGYAQFLRRAGYIVFEAASFEDGKRLWREIMPTVLVVDVRLGQYNGLQLLMRARVDRPDLKAIITCPFPDHVLEAETRRYGAIFLVKPLAPWQIVGAVSAALADEPDQQTPNDPPALQPPATERRQESRRKLVIPGFTPERRQADRRTPRA